MAANNPSNDARFSAIWNAALARYQQAVGRKFEPIPTPKDLAALEREINNRKLEFETYRNINKRLWGSISAIIGPVEVMGGVVAEGTSMVFPASPVIMGALSILLRGAKGVSNTYDYIEQLFDDMKAILARLQVHSRASLPVELRTIYVEILSCILEIIGVSTKYIASGRTKRFLKSTFRPDRDAASELKQKLVNLVGQETAMVGALDLAVTTDVLAQTVVVAGISETIDGKVDDLLDYVQEISVHLSSNIKQPCADLELNIKIPLRMPLPHNRNFTGRERQLSEIHDYLPALGPRRNPSIFALTGTGGMGKTQIALEYAYRYHGEYTAIFWVSAVTADTIRNSFVDIIQQIIHEQVRATVWPQSIPDYSSVALKLGLPGLVDTEGNVSTTSQHADAIQSALFQWLVLTGNTRWLLIYDNLDDLESFDIQQYLPKNGAGAILITSRRPELSHIAEQVDLKALEQDEALELLFGLSRIRSPSDDVTKDAVALVKKLGYLPLSICHAGCYLFEAKISIKEYEDCFDKAFMQMHSRIPRSGWNYRKDTAATTWEISLSEVLKQDADASIFLSTCSYLNRDKIGEHLFVEDSTDVRSKLKVKETVLLLSSYSLVKITQPGFFCIHPVVHAWARDRLDETQQMRAMERSLRAVGTISIRSLMSISSLVWKSQDWLDLQQHIQYLAIYMLPKFPDLTRYIQAADLGDMSKRCYWISDCLVSRLERLGERKMWLQAALVTNKMLPETLPNLHMRCRILHRLGGVHKATGESKLSAEFHEESVNCLEKLDWEKDEEYFGTAFQLSTVLSSQGKQEAATRFQNKVMSEAQRLKSLGKTCQYSTGKVLTVLRLYQQREEWGEYLEWLRVALDRLREEGNEFTPLAVLMQTRHSVCLEQLGKDYEALEVLQKLLHRIQDYPEAKFILGMRTNISKEIDRLHRKMRVPVETGS
ncbi:hypothetical protein DRE_01029 [Drechslerella stenobrocha 248]|uniref:NB-ARC domain-containing protein n=1 Tax=Drechslerella stenobrocha 248 TaxID=1043628 RepID=W7I7P0_9PEZI|nr:hypothetical protein DRE_01029 [Drechslerella stenobrocha 248]